MGLTLLGLSLRWIGRFADLPSVREPDLELTLGVELYRTPQGWQSGGERVRLADFYPRLLPRLISLGPAGWAGGEEFAADAGRPSSAATVLEVRAWVALLNALAVPLTYLLARRFVDAPAALFAAASLATSLLAVLFSHQARPHAVTTTATVLALLACVRATVRSTRASWIVAGAACGLSLGTLHNGVAILPALVVAAWVAGPTPRASARHLALSALGLLPLVLFSYPAALRGLVPRVSDDGGTLDLAGHTVLLRYFDGGGLQGLWRTLAGFEPVLGVAAALAALAWLRSRRRAAWRASPALAVVLAFALPYLLILVLYRDSRERFYSPLLPPLAIAAAWGLERLLARLAPARRASATLGLGALLLLPGLASCLRLDWLHRRPHGVRVLADWIAANVATAGARIALPTGVDLPLDWCREYGETDEPRCGERPTRIAMEFQSFDAFQAFVRDPLPSVRQWRASHYVLLVPEPGEHSTPPHPLLPWLEANARPLVVLPEPGVRVLGGGAASFQDSGVGLQPLFLQRLWSAQVRGGRMRLWAVREDAVLAD